MNQNTHFTYFKPEKQGVYPVNGGCLFATEIESFNDCGLILYDKNGTVTRIPFDRKGKRGALYGIMVQEEKFPFTSYNYYDGDRIFTDPYARGISGLEKYGEFGNDRRETKGTFFSEEYDWEEDSPIKTPYKDTIIYGLNVRSFTMHKSSGVKHKGTFEGIIEKTDYLKKLGITAIELMPAYEFDECIYASSSALRTMEEAVKNCTLDNRTGERVNCWGYQKGFYFAPKASYSADRPDISFKNMVKTMHKNGIEVMMQFYFPPELKPSYILEVLRYWVIEYHIDGVRLSGFNIPLSMIAEDPLLKETKIRSIYFPINEIYGDKKPFYRNLACDNGNFKNDMRRFLKGDENLINQVIFYQKNNPAGNAVVNYLADYDGFSLYDSVSYERKHNEANGENNSDGTDYNFSWNCGAEGESRKKAILKLRMKQIKNGLTFVLLSQGVPFLFSGDELANTRYGNNNAYCQDNETGWIKWKGNKFSEEIFRFTAELIAFRKKHPVLHLEEELKVMDTIGCGYPDISYHGTEAWCPDTSYISRVMGIMLCGDYAKEIQDDCMYIAINMHWEKHELALPKLPKGEKWIKVLTTAEDKQEQIHLDESRVLIEDRSISVFLSEKKQQEKVRKTKRKSSNVKEGMETF